MSLGPRERVLSAVELALGFPARDHSLLQPGESPSSVPWLPASEPWEALQRELEALSAKFHRVHKAEEFPSVMASILGEHALKKAVLWEHPILSALDVRGLLRDAGVSLIDGAQAGPFTKAAAEADLGVTAAECAIVESGAIMVRTSVGWERSTSLLPPIHLAILTAAQRVRTVWDLVPVWRDWLRRDGQLPSAIHLITGPSRTADIELTLVLGAHGPKVLHVLALDQEAVPEGDS